MASNVELVQSVYDAFGKGDVPAVLGAMHEKIDWQEPESLPFEDQIGPEAVAENTFGPVMAMFPNFTCVPSEIHDAGDTIFAIGTYRGTGAGGELETPFVHVWRVKDGKLPGSGRTPTHTSG